MDIRKFIVKSSENSVVKTVTNVSAPVDHCKKRQHEDEEVDKEKDGKEVVAKESRTELDSERSEYPDASKWIEPHQPSANTLPSRTTKKSKLYFQAAWYREFPWLHYSSTVQKFFCFYCAKACQDKSHAWSRNVEPAFVSAGLYNLKKALEKFRHHQQSHSHFLALSHCQNQRNPVDVQLCRQKQQQQVINSRCLRAIVSSVQYLGQCGLALQGHSGDSGNFLELLKLISQDLPELGSWLECQNSYTSSSIQRLCAVKRQ